MIKSKNSISERGIEIDLTGPDGYAFYLKVVLKYPHRTAGLSKMEFLLREPECLYDNYNITNYRFL